MEILGVGPAELLFILIIALIILGPKDMEKAGRTIGTWLRSIVTSDGWKVFQKTSNELRTLPNRLIREANEELNQIDKGLKNASDSAPAGSVNPNSPPRSQPLTSPPRAFPENNIAPPQPTPPPDDKEENA